MNRKRYINIPLHLWPVILIFIGKKKIQKATSGNRQKQGRVKFRNKKTSDQWPGFLNEGQIP